MDLNSPIFDRIRAKPKTKEPVQTVKVRCDHPGCNEAGDSARPKAGSARANISASVSNMCAPIMRPDNYFQGMSAEAVSLYQRDASTGHRPTWVMGDNIAGGPQGRGADSAHYADPLNILGGARAARKAQEPPKPKHGIAARKALDQLGLDEVPTPP